MVRHHAAQGAVPAGGSASVVAAAGGGVSFFAAGLGGNGPVGVVAGGEALCRAAEPGATSAVGTGPMGAAARRPPGCCCPVSSRHSRRCTGPGCAAWGLTNCHYLIQLTVNHRLDARPGGRCDRTRGPSPAGLAPSPAAGVLAGLTGPSSTRDPEPGLSSSALVLVRPAYLPCSRSFWPLYGFQGYPVGPRDHWLYTTSRVIR